MTYDEIKKLNIKKQLVYGRVFVLIVVIVTVMIIICFKRHIGSPYRAIRPHQMFLISVYLLPVIFKQLFKNLLLLKQNSILRQNQDESCPNLCNFFLRFPNVLHGIHFVCIVMYSSIDYSAFTLIMQNHVYAVGLFIATHFQNYYWTKLYLYRTKI